MVTGRTAVSQLCLDFELIFQWNVHKIANDIIDSAKRLLKAEEDREADIQQMSVNTVNQAICAAYKCWQNAAEAGERGRVRKYVLDAMESSLDEIIDVPSSATLSESTENEPELAETAKKLIITAIRKASKRLFGDVESSILASTKISEEQINEAALELAEDTILNATTSLQSLGVMAFEINEKTGLTAITQKLAKEAISTASRSIERLNLSGDIENVIRKVFNGAVSAAQKSLEELRDIKERAPYSYQKECPIIISDYLTDIPGEQANEEDSWDEAVKAIAKRAMCSAAESIERMETVPYQEKVPEQVVTEAVWAAKRSLELLCNPTEEYERELQRKLKDVVRTAMISAENSLERLGRRGLYGAFGSKAVVSKEGGNDWPGEQSHSLSSGSSTPRFVSASESLDDNLNYAAVVQLEDGKAISGAMPNVGDVGTSDSNITSSVVDGSAMSQSLSPESITAGFVSALESLSGNINNDTAATYVTETFPANPEGAITSTSLEEAVEGVVSLSKQQRSSKSLKIPPAATSRTSRDVQQAEVGDKEAPLEETVYDKAMGIEPDVDKAAGELSRNAVISAENSIERFYKQELSSECVESRETGLRNTVLEVVRQAVTTGNEIVQQKQQVKGTVKRGKMMWLVMQYVEGIINYAMNHAQSDQASEDEICTVITPEEAYQTALEYSTSENVFINESYSLVACRVVNDILRSSVEFILQESTRRRFTLSDSNDSEEPRGRSRKSSIQFSERSITSTRRESYAPRESDFRSVLNRPPTPIRRRNVSNEELKIDEEADEQIATSPLPTDDSWTNTKGSEINQNQEYNRLEEEKIVSPTQTVECDLNSSTWTQQKPSKTCSSFEILASREGKEECEILPSSSYVLLPPLHPSEHSLIAARIAQTSEESKNRQESPTPAAGDLPVIPQKRSLVAIISSLSDTSLEGGSGTRQPSGYITHLPEISSSNSLVASSSSANTVIIQDSTQDLPSGEVEVKASRTKSSQDSPPTSEVITKSALQTSRGAPKTSARKSKEGMKVSQLVSEQASIISATSSEKMDMQSADDVRRKHAVSPELAGTSSALSVKPHHPSVAAAAEAAISFRSSRREPPLSSKTSKKELFQTSPTTLQKTAARQSESCSSSGETLKASEASLTEDSMVNGCAHARQGASVRLSKEALKLTPKSSRNDMAVLSRKSSKDTTHCSRYEVSVKISSHSSKGVVKAPGSVLSQAGQISSTSHQESAKTTFPSKLPEITLEKDIQGKDLPCINKALQASSQESIQHHSVETETSNASPGASIKEIHASSVRTSQEAKIVLVEQKSKENRKENQTGPKEQTAILSSSSADRVNTDSSTEELETIQKSSLGLGNDVASTVSQESRKSIRLSPKGSRALALRKLKEDEARSPNSSLKDTRLQKYTSQQAKEISRVGPVKKHHKISPKASKGNASISLSISSKIENVSTRPSDESVKERSVATVHQTTNKHSSKPMSDSSEGMTDEGDLQFRRSDKSTASSKSSVPSKSFQEPEVVIWREVVKNKESVFGEKTSGKHRIVDDLKDKEQVEEIHVEASKAAEMVSIVGTDDKDSSPVPITKSSLPESSVPLSSSSSATKKARPSYPRLSTVKLKTNASIKGSDRQPAKTASGQQLPSPISSSSSNEPAVESIRKERVKKDTMKSSDMKISKSAESRSSVFVSPQGSALLTIAPLTPRQSSPKKTHNDPKTSEQINSPVHASGKSSNVSLSPKASKPKVRNSTELSHDSYTLSGVVGAAIVREQSQQMTSGSSTSTLVCAPEALHDNGNDASPDSITETSGTEPDNRASTDNTSPKPVDMGKLVSGVVGAAVRQVPSESSSLSQKNGNEAAKNGAKSKVLPRGSRGSMGISQQSRGSKKSITSRKTSQEELKRNSTEHLQITGIAPCPPAEAQVSAKCSTSKFSIAQVPSKEDAYAVTPKSSISQMILPSPPSGPKPKIVSPRRSNIKTVPSDESTQLTPTHSETSVDSLVSEDQHDVAPRVSDAWIATRKEEVLKVVGAHLPTRARSTSSLPKRRPSLKSNPLAQRTTNEITLLKISSSSLRRSQLNVDTPIVADLKPIFQVQGTSIVKSS